MRDDCFASGGLRCSDPSHNKDATVILDASLGSFRQFIHRNTQICLPLRSQSNVFDWPAISSSSTCSQTVIRCSSWKQIHWVGRGQIPCDSLSSLCGVKQITQIYGTFMLGSGGRHQACAWRVQRRDSQQWLLKTEKLHLIGGLPLWFTVKWTNLSNRFDTDTQIQPAQGKIHPSIDLNIEWRYVPRSETEKSCCWSRTLDLSWGLLPITWTNTLWRKFLWFNKIKTRWLPWEALFWKVGLLLWLLSK